MGSLVKQERQQNEKAAGEPAAAGERCRRVRERWFLSCDD